jgi:glycosyltransferase involved in cell wall biosynthesis
MKLLVAIFAHNESSTIESVINSIPRQIPGISILDIVVIDDGSDDTTAQIASTAGVRVIRHNRNRGLASAFMTAVNEAIDTKADILVHTDGDNQYNQGRILDLVQHLVSNDADAVVGNRKVRELTFMPFGNKMGNLVGNNILNWLLDLHDIDMSSGFRAYTRDCFSRLIIFSKHTYTHETLIQLSSMGFTVLSSPVEFKPRANGDSRLIKSLYQHITKSLITIIRSILYYKPLRSFATSASLLITIGLLLGARYLLFFLNGDSTGHIQSLILMSICVVLGFLLLALGLIADIINRSTRIQMEILTRQRVSSQVKATRHT